MPTTLKAVAEAFEHLFEALHDAGFRKTMSLRTLGERELLRHIRFFLLGWFRRSALAVEGTVAFPWTTSGTGRVDFFIDDIAIEVAVRRPRRAKANLLSVVNAPEMVKLVKHPGKAMLVLFDFSADPLTAEDLSAFRDVPSIGQGNHHKSSFHVYYFNKVRGLSAVREDAQESVFAPLHLHVTP